MKGKYWIYGLILFGLVIALSCAVKGATIDVSQPKALTDDEGADWSADILKIGSDYWLFYTHNDTVKNHADGVGSEYCKYSIKYRTASSIDGLLTATPQTIPNSNPLPRGRIVSAVYYNDEIWVFHADGGSGSGIYYYKYSSGTWSGPNALGSELSGASTAGEVDAIIANNMIYLFYPNAAGLQVASYDGTWHHNATIATSAYIPEAIYDGNNFYVVWTAQHHINISSSSDGNTWTTAGSIADPGIGAYDAWDPTIAKLDGTFYMFYAPYDWTGGNNRQWLGGKTSTDPINTTSWSDEKVVTCACYGSNQWWDLQPITYVEGNNLYLIYQTEGDNHAIGDADIVYYLIDWDVSHDHYEAIQPAIDAASNGDTIKVNEGTYYENIVINKEIILVGDPVIDAHGGVGISIEANNTLVENFTIYNGSIGIYVHNESFIIQNVTINNCTAYKCLTNESYGINLHNVSNSWVNNTQVNDTLCGMVLNNSLYINVTDCTAYNNTVAGIYLYYSNSNNITNCTVYNNTGIQGYGIYLYHSSDNNITDCNVYNNFHGIHLFYSSNNNIISNDVYNNSGDGIFVASSSNHIISNDVYNNSNGINITGSISFYNNIISNDVYNNSGDGICLYSYSTHNNITSNYVYNNSNGIYLDYSSNNNIISNYVYNNSNGIYLRISSISNNITDCNVYNNSYGIEIGSSSNHNTLTGCNAYNNTWYGIKISSSSNNNITGCNVHNNTYNGIYITSSHWNNITSNTIHFNNQINSSGNAGLNLFKSENNTAIGNIIHNNPWYGVILEQSHNNTFSLNEIINNCGGVAGVVLYDGDYNIFDTNNISENTGDGIEMYESDYNKINNSTISGNNYNGTYLHFSHRNEITNSTIKENNQDGIYLYGSENNTIANCNISGHPANAGIYLGYDSNTNKILECNISSNDYGIYIHSSHYNNITDCDAYENNNGTCLDASHYNILNNCNIYNNTYYGVYLESISNNNNISYCNFSGNGDADIYVSGNDNEIFFCQFSSYPTNASVLSYSGSFSLKGVDSPPSDPDDWRNIGKYIEANGDSWINLSIYYEDETYENCYEMWKYSMAGGWLRGEWYESKGVNTAENYVWANITSFSIFAPLIETVPPVTTKEIGEPEYDEWVNYSTPIWLNATDEESGVNGTYYRIYFNGQWHPLNGNDVYCGNSNITEIDGTYFYIYFLNGSINFGPIHFHEECEHIIEFFSIDNAGNVETTHNQTHYVDNTPPTTTLTFGTPYYTDGTDEWITSATQITLTATDAPDCACGVYKIYYRINGGSWIEYTAPFTIPSECTHTIEYYAVDYLGNTETAKSITVKVDNTPPTITKEFEGAKYNQHITSQTTIYVNATDAGLCPVGSVYLNVSIYSFETEEWTYYETEVESGTATLSFTIPEECEHWINITAIDDLGNTAYDNQTVYVDNSAPFADVDEIDPYCQLVNEENPVTITATAYDLPDGDCGVGIAYITLYYRFSRYNSSNMSRWTEWIEYETIYNEPWSWEFNAPEGAGYYQFYTVAYDFLGHHEELPDENTAPEAMLCVKYTHTYTLYPNWNMITIPVKNEFITNAEELGNFLNSQDCGVTVIVKFDAKEQKYISRVIGISGENFAITPGEGYWIFTTLDESKEFSIEGCLIEEKEINISLYIGYNLIGWANIEDTYAGILADNIPNCTKVDRWDASNQEWKTGYIREVGEVDFNIYIGDGVFVFRNKGGVIAWDGGRSFLSLPL
ncbi:MAG: right-handed parallel beta-helix repeat-containing protein [Thermoplasmatales archaeon]|nr:right-handed parallel beta-helix repeat-containing protein [Thermoplasmatales archaeon]